MKKTVDGVETIIPWYGNQLVHLKKGSLQMHFFYDGQGRPGLVTYNGSDYYNMYNLQGDVVGLVDPSNQLVGARIAHCATSTQAEHSAKLNTD